MENYLRPLSFGCEQLQQWITSMLQPLYLKCKKKIQVSLDKIKVSKEYFDNSQHVATTLTEMQEDNTSVT